MSEQESSLRSKLPMVSLFLSALSFLGLAVFPLFVFCIVALPLAVYSSVTARRCSPKPAMFSGALSLAAFIIAPSWYVHMYNTEACTNHERVTFSTIGNGSGLDSYAGRSICVKGYSISNNPDEPTTTIYINPDGSRSALKTIVEVHLPYGWQHTEDPIAVSGTLIINDSGHFPRYTLRAVDVRPSKTKIGIESRAPSFGC